jgi:hypothetical protein
MLIVLLGMRLINMLVSEVFVSHTGELNIAAQSRPNLRDPSDLRLH